MLLKVADADGLELLGVYIRRGITTILHSAAAGGPWIPMGSPPGS